MIYLWRVVSDECPEKFIGEYDRKISPDRFLLKQGRVLSASEFNVPVVRFNISMSKAKNLDVLSSNAMVPLVSSRLANYLMEISPHDVQLIPTIIEAKDGEIEGYKFVNILHKVMGIDKSVSKIDYMVNDPAYIRGFRYLKYLEGSMGEHFFARDAEYSSNLLVAEKAVNCLRKERFTGLALHDPEAIKW